MLSPLLLLLPALLAPPALGAPGDHGDHETPTKEVVTDIERVSMVYNEQLCLDLLLFPCSKHDATGEPVICGSDGRTYSDHCTFAHARCIFHTLRFVASGPCSATISPPVTIPAVTATTMGVTGTVTMAASTPKPTVDASWQFVKDVFCQNVVAISCNNAPAEPVCGTDGNVYPNHCLLAKVKCYVASLEVADNPNACTSTTSR